MKTDHDAGPSQAELIEDLRLHQVQLEVQAEELQRAKAQISALSDRYRTLFARAPVAMLTVGDDRLAVDPSAPPVVLMSGHGNGRDTVLPTFTAAQLLSELGAALAGDGGPA